MVPGSFRSGPISGSKSGAAHQRAAQSTGLGSPSLVLLYKSYVRSLLILLSTFALQAATPVPIIFDTDMGNDVDDVIALAVLHSLETRGEAKILAVTITKDNRFAGPFVALLNRTYQRPNIPIGVVNDGATKDDGKYLRPVLKSFRTPATATYPDAVELLRKTLTAQPDNSVVIVQVGFSTNLARLLASDRELIEKKVKLLCAMAGNFAEPTPEFNVVRDIPSAQKVFGEWPGDVVTSGFEVGRAIRYPAARIESDFAWAQKSPVVEAYRAYKDMPYDEPLWDPSAALYAVRPESGYYSLSPAGKIQVDKAGITRFVEGDGRQHYLVVDEVQKARVLEAISLLASQPRGR
jgi:inosine-uridine nucleoside N-ribohydrolase